MNELTTISVPEFAITRTSKPTKKGVVKTVRRGILRTVISGSKADRLLLGVHEGLELYSRHRYVELLEDFLSVFPDGRKAINARNDALATLESDVVKNAKPICIGNPGKAGFLAAIAVIFRAYPPESLKGEKAALWAVAQAIVKAEQELQIKLAAPKAESESA